MSDKLVSVVDLPVIKATIPRSSGVAGTTGAQVVRGVDGATFTPTVTPEGYLYWKNDKDLPNPNPVKIRGADGKPGANGTSVTHRWDGTVLTITSASGTSSADLKGESFDPDELFPLIFTADSDMNADVTLEELIEAMLTSRNIYFEGVDFEGNSSIVAAIGIYNNSLLFAPLITEDGQIYVINLNLKTLKVDWLDASELLGKGTVEPLVVMVNRDENGAMIPSHTALEIMTALEEGRMVALLYELSLLNVMSVTYDTIIFAPIIDKNKWVFCCIDGADNTFRTAEVDYLTLDALEQAKPKIVDLTEFKIDSGDELLSSINDAILVLLNMSAQSNGELVQVNVTDTNLALRNALSTDQHILLAMHDTTGVVSEVPTVIMKNEGVAIQATASSMFFSNGAVIDLNVILVYNYNQEDDNVRIVVKATATPID